MANREKIIKNIKAIRAFCNINPYKTELSIIAEAFEDWKTILDDAFELLKEQEALAVYEGKVNKCVCGNGINRYWHPKYCGFCGKKLEWY